MDVTIFLLAALQSTRNLSSWNRSDSKAWCQSNTPTGGSLLHLLYEFSQLPHTDTPSPPLLILFSKIGLLSSHLRLVLPIRLFKESLCELLLVHAW